MTLRNVAHWLSDHPGFQKQLGRLTVDYVSKQFDGALLETESFSHDWRYLLFCGSILAESHRGSDQDAALRIAHACLELVSENGVHKDAAASILDKLSNRVAIAMAESKDILQAGLEQRLPLPLRIEWTRNYYEHSVRLADSLIPVNRFQKKLWTALRDNQVVSASAPTATGKSYLLINWIKSLVENLSDAIIVYLVPTRALISEVERKLRYSFTLEKSRPVNVTSVPSIDSLQPKKPNILVFTQERLQILLTSRPDLPVFAMVVDEAHKVGDGQRGVLLQQVVEQVQSDNPDVRIVFSSPLAKNPDYLLSDSDVAISKGSIASEDVTVNQNLIWVSQKRGKPTKWTMQLMQSGVSSELGEFDLHNSPSPDSKRLPFVAYALAGSSPGNVIYANGAASAETIAGHVYRLLGGKRTEVDPDLTALIDLVKKTVHREYLLAKVLECGVAFHYGNMPLLIKSEVERLFSKNVIQYLVCTSTLVEGVNMACKNMFLRGPTKGRARPMEREDFWNLAGRAGRWGHDFQGNVICVDATVERLWKNGEAPRKRGTYPIERTTDQVLGDPTDLLSFLEQGTPRETAQKRPDLEYMSSYLLSKHFRLGSLANTPWANRVDQETLRAVGDVVERIAKQLIVPEALIHRNPGVSPLALDALLMYFRKREKEVEDLLPVNPISEDAAKAYTSVFARAYRYLGAPLGPSGRSFMLAILVTEWMRGYPLSRLIDRRIAWHRSRESTTKLATIIRNVMEDVERIARFEAPKAISAYSDVLGVHLNEIGRQDLIDEIPDVSLLLEFGVSQTTQISLMSLGLSRTAAIELSEFIVSDSMTKSESLQWLRSREWVGEDLPLLVNREIEELLDTYEDELSHG